MKTNKDYILRCISDEYILVPTGASTMDFNGLINLSEVAAFIWKNLDDAADLEDLIQKVLAEYEIDEATARQDVYGFVNSLVENKMAEV